jgi:hypothetical protein
MGTGLNSTGRDVVAIGKHIYLAGYFTTAGSTSSQYFAEWLETQPVEKRPAKGDPRDPSFVAAATTAFELKQNAPNPFNPTTQILFSLASTSHVRLAIYDAQGKLVRTLVNEERRPGNYAANWNGRDNHDGAVASGVYFCVMRAGSFEATTKMVLLK